VNLVAAALAHAAVPPADPVRIILVSLAEATVAATVGAAADVHAGALEGHHTVLA
jgi:hypothetical protein